MTWRKAILCALLTTLLPLAAHAEHTRFWRQSDYDDFQRGTATGVAVRSDGKITPAPRFESFADPGMSFLWSLRLDAQGRLYAAGGSDAKVLRFDSVGKSTTIFESSELAAQAIAFDSKGDLYVGTSPDGKVYKVTPDGTKSVFFDPKTKYIWSLAVDPQGDVFVGTGDKGEIFVVSPDGNGKSFYQSDQRHARALAFDSRGNLLVGTEPDGLILRIPITRTISAAPPESGAPFVLYETSEKEVTSLLPDSNGNIYAAAIGEKTRGSNAPMPPAPAQQVIQTSSSPSAPAAQVSSSASSNQAQTVIVQPSIPASFLGASANGAEIVKIAPDDSPEVLWSSRDEIVLSLGLSADGKLLLGTGNRGEIIRLEGNGAYSNIEQASAMQVTSLVTAPDGKIYAASANPGEVFALGPGFQPNGNFVSATYDASIFSRWGRLTWWGEDGGAQGRVQFYVRSGNTSNPENNWSEWSGPYKSASGETATCPPARFVQWKAAFLKSDTGGQPSISWVSLAFQPENVAPVIDAIALQDPGVRVAGFAQQGGQSSPAPIQLHVPERAEADTSGQSNDAEASGRPARIEIPPQAVQDHGYQSVLWSAHDDNDDALTFSIYYRGEGEKNWRLLKDKISEQYYSWDTSTMPDGAYYLKIVASDAPSNPPDEALTAERESDRFLVGNTPPRVEDLRAQPTSQSATLSFGATGTSGAIARASYSLDSADWQIVFPVGQLTDSPKEEYKWDIANLSPGEHTVSVRVTDRFGNETAAKITFNVAASTAATTTSASAR